MAGNTGSIKLIDNASVLASTDTTYSSVNGSAWVEVPSGFSFTLWYWVSGTGTQSITLTLDVSPYSAASLASTTADTTLYVSETIVSSYATNDTLVRYGSSTVMGSPFVSLRVRAKGESGNDATGSLATVILTKFQLG